MKYIRQINEFLESDSQRKTKFKSKDELIKYLCLEMKKQGENVVIKDLDVSNIKDLSELFRDIRENVDAVDDVNTLDLSGWKTSHVYDMSSMFS